MLSTEQTVIFVWRCVSCSTVYENEGLRFLYADEVRWYCPCGGRLVEAVEPAAGRHYSVTIPGSLRGTRLHRQLARLVDGESVEVTVGDREFSHISVCCGPEP